VSGGSLIIYCHRLRRPWMKPGGNGDFYIQIRGQNRFYLYKIHCIILIA
jgi:hypothetical protein